MRPQDLSDLLKPGQADVYILGDVDSTAFTKEDLTNLAAAVERGASLMMTGGAQSFGAGGYWDTPLGKVLPVVMDRLERQDPNGPLRKDLHLPGPLKMQLTQAGEEIFHLLPGESRQANAALWKQLPAVGRRQQAHRDAGVVGSGGRPGGPSAVGRRQLGQRPGAGLRRRFDVAVVDARIRDRPQAVLA